ncbi:MAG: hypothetical protein Q9159_006330 [Coniocarpon cinnabarinum]
MDHLPFEIRAVPVIVPYFPWSIRNRVERGLSGPDTQGLWSWIRRFLTTCSIPKDNGSAAARIERGLYGTDKLLESLVSFAALGGTEMDVQVRNELLISVIQQRLFFDTIESVFTVCGYPYHQADFLCPAGEGRQRVDTTELKRYLCHWHVCEDGKSAQIVKAHQECCVQILKDVHATITKVEEQFVLWNELDENALSSTHNGTLNEKALVADPFSASYPRANMVRLSIGLLVETLNDALPSVFSRYRIKDDVPHLGGWLAVDSRKDIMLSPFELRWQKDRIFVHQLLRQAGWCPYEIQHIQARTGGIASALTRLQQARRRSPAEHDNCTTSSCDIDQLHAEKYRQSHRPGCSGCSLLRARDARNASPEDSSAAGSDGLVAHMYAEGELVTRDLAQSDYVAISHVWSDGMGNPKENALPTCTLRFLQSTVSHAYHEASSGWSSNSTSLAPRRSESVETPIPFWIDTMCVPVKPEPARKKMIAAMRRIYEEASMVLVDSWLMAQSSLEGPEQTIPPSALEGAKNLHEVRNAFAALLTSVIAQQWISDETWVRSGRSISFSRVLARLIDFYTREQRSQAHVLLKSVVGPPTKLKDSDPFSCLREVSPMLSRRRTSHAGDEAICLASLLNLDLAKIVHTAPERRMKKLFIEMGTLPHDFLFFTGPRMTEFGSSWVPRTFVQSNTTYHFGNPPLHYTDSSPDVFPREDGLFVPSGGLRLSNEWRSAVYKQVNQMLVQFANGAIYHAVILDELALRQIHEEGCELGMILGALDDDEPDLSIVCVCSMEPIIGSSTQRGHVVAQGLLSSNRHPGVFTTSLQDYLERTREWDPVPTVHALHQKEWLLV